MSIRTTSVVAFAAALWLLLVACGGGGDNADDSGGDGGETTSASVSQTSSFDAQDVGDEFNPNIQPVIVNSSLGVGPNRMSVGFFRSDNSLLLDGTVTMHLYRLDQEDQGSLVGDYPMQAASISTQSEHEHADGSTHVHTDPFATLFATNVEFDAAGFWGATFDITTPEGETFQAVKAAKFPVLDHTSEPSIGDPMPRSVTLTLDDVDDISQIDTSTDPIPAMHELTVAQALDTGKPVLVAIATPAFCQTRFCGPMMEEVVDPLYERLGDVATFVHVEPYDIPKARSGQLVPVPMLAEWGLQTEPWIFIADREGNVVAKFEGIASLDEVENALMHAIETNPDK